MKRCWCVRGKYQPPMPWFLCDITRRDIVMFVFWVSIPVTCCPLVASIASCFAFDARCPIRFLPFMRQSLTWRSSPAETIRGRVGWNVAQLTLRSCPSKTYLTIASVLPKMSACCEARCALSSYETVPGAAFFLRRPIGNSQYSQTNSQMVEVSPSIFHVFVCSNLEIATYPPLIRP